MPKQGDVHAVWSADAKRWRVEVTGNQRASGTHAAKEGAVAQARRLAKRNHSELVIHKQDGTIGQRDSHGNDPNPPKG